MLWDTGLLLVGQRNLQLTPVLSFHCPNKSSLVLTASGCFPVLGNLPQFPRTQSEVVHHVLCSCFSQRLGAGTTTDWYLMYCTSGSCVVFLSIYHASFSVDLMAHPSCVSVPHILWLLLSFCITFYNLEETISLFTTKVPQRRTTDKS